jgi:hypothetical protein
VDGIRGRRGLAGAAGAPGPTGPTGPAAPLEYTSQLVTSRLSLGSSPALVNPIEGTFFSSPGDSTGQTSTFVDDGIAVLQGSGKVSCWVQSKIAQPILGTSVTSYRVLHRDPAAIAWLKGGRPKTLFVTGVLNQGWFVESGRTGAIATSLVCRDDGLDRVDVLGATLTTTEVSSATQSPLRQRFHRTGR